MTAVDQGKVRRGDVRPWHLAEIAICRVPFHDSSGRVSQISFDLAWPKRGRLRNAAADLVLIFLWLVVFVIFRLSMLGANATLALPRRDW
jgi:hypothetical protein